MINKLLNRSSAKCELCTSDKDLTAYSLNGGESADENVLLCSKCVEKIKNENFDDHFRVLSSSMWNENIPVQVLSYRVLSKMKEVPWAQDLFSQMYLDDKYIQLAISNESEPPKDSNGVFLKEGDDVTLIKDLVVKGANFTAKRGTLVKNIRMSDDSRHIEGKINGTRIVLVSAFLKKV